MAGRVSSEIGGWREANSDGPVLLGTVDRDDQEANRVPVALSSVTTYHDRPKSLRRSLDLARDEFHPRVGTCDVPKTRSDASSNEPGGAIRNAMTTSPSGLTRRALSPALASLHVCPDRRRGSRLPRSRARHTPAIGRSSQRALVALGPRCWRHWPQECRYREYRQRYPWEQRLSRPGRMRTIAEIASRTHRVPITRTGPRNGKPSISDMRIGEPCPSGCDQIGEAIPAISDLVGEPCAVRLRPGRRTSANIQEPRRSGCDRFGEPGASDPQRPVDSASSMRLQPDRRTGAREQGNGSTVSYL